MVPDTGTVSFLANEATVDITVQNESGDVVFTGQTSDGKLEGLKLPVGIYFFQGRNETGSIQKYKYPIESGNNTITFVFN